jgi:hypothetical protein
MDDISIGKSLVDSFYYEIAHISFTISVKKTIWTLITAKALIKFVPFLGVLLNDAART